MDIKDDYKNEMLDLIKQNIDSQEQETVEEVETENVETETIQEETPKEKTENNESEDQEKIETDNEIEINIEKELSGLPKEMVETVKTFKDPEDRAKAIKIAKEQRAREDRLHLQLGNTKKELENIGGLLRNLETNPAETFKALAKQVNFDLKQVVDETVYEDELYLTPEEQIKRETQKIQNNSYQLLQQEVNKREAKELLAEFLEDPSHSEDLIIEYQPEFVNIYNQELAKNGTKDYHSLKERRKALEIAYSKIERLQPDYEDKIRDKILREINEQKKEKFDDAKKQQRISKPVANSNKPLTYQEEQLALIRKFT